jgi:hypothetical protein
MKPMITTTVHTHSEITAIQRIRCMEGEIKKLIIISHDPILSSLKPEKTAIHRSTITVPLRKALDVMDFSGKIGIDFGCGKAIDSQHLRSMGSECFDYDPLFCPISKQNRERTELSDTDQLPEFDYLLLIYILNVVPPEIRSIIARTAQSLIHPIHGKIIIGVRDDSDAIKPAWKKYQDGHVTTAHTFQCFFPSNSEGKAKLEALFPGMIAKSLGRGAWILSFR